MTVNSPGLFLGFDDGVQQVELASQFRRRGLEANLSQDAIGVAVVTGEEPSGASAGMNQCVTNLVCVYDPCLRSQELPVLLADNRQRSAGK